MQKREVEQISLKLEKSLVQKIRKEAIEDKRSFSMQIEYMLERYYVIKKMTN